MIRTLALSTLLPCAAMLGLAPLAQAQSGYYDGYGGQSVRGGCAQESDANLLAGSLIGAVAGGVLGAAIAGSGDDNDDYYRGRGHRGRGHYGHGYGGYHGGDDGGDQVAGALIGGILGAVVGGAVAQGASDCNAPPARYAYSDVPPPTRQPFAGNRLSGGAPQTFPVSAQPTYERELFGAPDEYARDGDSLQAGTDCETVQRQTRLQDGSTVLEPVRICQRPDGSWDMTDAVGGY